MSFFVNGWRIVSGAFFTVRFAVANLADAPHGRRCGFHRRQWNSVRASRNRKAFVINYFYRSSARACNFGSRWLCTRFAENGISWLCSGVFVKGAAQEEFRSAGGRSANYMTAHANFRANCWMAGE